MILLIALACTKDAPPEDSTSPVDPDPDGDGWLEEEDCDQNDPGVHPEAPETPDSQDQDCDGLIDEGTSVYDDDGDGLSEEQGDCDDANPEVNPEATDTWYDGVDSDCAGDSDFDQDKDGADSPADCDDTDAAVFPGAADEWYDGEDSDCAGNSDFDADLDGFDSPDEDCDDTDPTVYVGAAEVCDGAKDEDCDGEVDESVDVLGDDALCAATDCLEIRRARPDAPDGVYWVDVDGNTHDLVCDMSTDFGGWTLVASFVYPGHTNGVMGWTSGNAVGSTTNDITQTFKLSDAEINSLVQFRYRATGTATWCTLDGGGAGSCAVNTTLYWSSDCEYASGSSSTGACTAAYETYDLDGWTGLSNPCSWHYGLTSADCGVTSEFGTSHEGDHVFAGIVGTYTHAYDGRTSEDPSIEVWVR